MKQDPDRAGVRAADARLTESRERMVRWLAADREAQSPPALGHLAMGAVGVVWPLIQGLRTHPAAPLAMGALGQVRRHPKTALALVGLAAGAAWWLSRSRTASLQP